VRATRFSIGNLLAVIAILGVALAAMRNPSYLWANATFTVALAAIVAAVVNVVVGRGARRAYWLGFALFGGTYLAICSIPLLRDTVCPHLVTEAVFDMIYPFTGPDAGSRPYSAPVTFTRTFNNANVTFNATPGAVNVAPSLIPAPPPVAPNVNPALSPFQSTYVMGPPTYVVNAPVSVATSPWAAWTAPDRSIGVGYQIGSINLVSSEAFRQIGHSLSALLAATLGGLFARNRYQAYTRDSEPAVGQASA
jgi:hypothetical protein